MGSILITGGAGFIGSALMKRIGSKAEAISGRAPKCNWVPLLQRAECLVHLAARVHVMSDVVEDPLAEYRLSNVNLTVDLAQEAARAGVRRFVFISSVKVNGDETTTGRAFTAWDTPQPQDPYAISKMEAEKALLSIAENTGLEVVIIRPPLVYGLGVSANFGALMRAVSLGVPLPLGGIDNRRSLVALDNLIDLIVTCVYHPRAPGHVWMVSDGEDLSTTELVRRMAIAMGRNASLINLPVGLLEMLGYLTGKSHLVHRLCSSLQVDISETEALLGWKPPINVDEGLRRSTLRLLN